MLATGGTLVLLGILGLIVFPIVWLIQALRHRAKKRVFIVGIPISLLAFVIGVSLLASLAPPPTETAVPPHTGAPSTEPTPTPQKQPVEIETATPPTKPTPKPEKQLPLLDIPSFAKKSRQEIIRLLGSHVATEDDISKELSLEFQINRGGVQKLIVSYDCRRSRKNPDLYGFEVCFKPYLQGYRRALKKLGLDSTIPPDVTAQAVYRWEEHTKLNGFHSVQALRLPGGKIDRVSVWLSAERD